MRNKIFLLLFLSIISIFGNIIEEIKEKPYQYFFTTEKINEFKNKKRDTTILLNFSRKSLELTTSLDKNRNKKEDDFNNHNFHTYLINFNFSSMLKVYLNNLNSLYFFKINKLTLTILNRYKNRVLRI
nr:hypothetical protein [uncultured Cetobacterium sp.]